MKVPKPEQVGQTTVTGIGNQAPDQQASTGEKFFTPTRNRIASSSLKQKNSLPDEGRHPDMSESIQCPQHFRAGTQADPYRTIQNGKKKPLAY